MSDGHPILEVRLAGRAPLLVVVDRPIELGRECDGVLLDDEQVSRRHLAVEPAGGTCAVTDLGSSNGTLHNGARLMPGARLGAEDVVVLGTTEVRLSPLRAGSPSTGTTPSPGRSAGATVAADADERGTVIRPRRPAGANDRDDRGGDGADASSGAPDPLRATAIGALAEVVADDRATLARLSRASLASSGTLTFLFSDIESSTETAERLGDRRWYELLRAHDELIGRQVAAAGGTLVKSLGDGHLCTFGSARSAVTCAVAIQRSLLDQRHAGVRVRMGLHTGEAISVDGDYFGLHVNVAARVAGRARGGEILVSGLTRSVVETAGDLSFEDPLQVELKGLSGVWSVSALIWSSDGG